MDPTESCSAPSSSNEFNKSVFTSRNTLATCEHTTATPLFILFFVNYLIFFYCFNLILFIVFYFIILLFIYLIILSNFKMMIIKIK